MGGQRPHSAAPGPWPPLPFVLVMLGLPQTGVPPRLRVRVEFESLLKPRGPNFLNVHFRDSNVIAYFRKIEASLLGPWVVLMSQCVERTVLVTSLPVPMLSHI